MSILPSLVRIQLLMDLYLGLFLETVIEVRLLQPEKAEWLILVTLSGISIDWRLGQSPNASSPISVTLSGISIDCRLVQPLNADFSISSFRQELFLFRLLLYIP